MDLEEISKEAVTWANANKKSVARERADLDRFPSEEAPVSIFMAGSPVIAEIN